MAMDKASALTSKRDKLEETDKNLQNALNKMSQAKRALDRLENVLKDLTEQIGVAKNDYETSKKEYDAL